MSVAHDAVSESHTGTTGVASVASFTWDHVPAGTPRSALVFTFALGANPVTGVTYGGTAMTAIPYTAYDSDTEPYFVQAWFLDNCGSGTKAVVVNRTNNAVVTYATCNTQTAAGPCEVYLAGVMTQACGTSNTAASSTATGTGTAGLKAVDDGSPGTNSQRYMAMGYGGSNVLAAGTGSTSLTTAGAIDFGTFVICTYRETTPGQGARDVGSASGSDDLALIALAVREVPVDNRNASVTATGGGVAVESGTKGGTLATGATGGGVAAVSASGAHNVAAVATGGGVAVPAIAGGRAGSVVASGGGVSVVGPVAGRQSAPAATGGGVATVTAEAAISAENHNVDVVSTGGGVAAVGIRSDRLTSLASVGGGVASVAQLTARSTSPSATGGGVASASVQSAREFAALLSGGGVLTTDQATDRPSSVAVTGGGIVTVVAEAVSGDGVIASIVATGGGVVAIVSTTDRNPQLAATGSGIASLSVLSARQLAVALTGGGTLVVSNYAPPLAIDLRLGEVGLVIGNGGGAMAIASGTAGLDITDHGLGLEVVG